MSRFIGVDIGTGNIATCVTNGKTEIKKFNRTKDAFFKIEGQNQSLVENMLKMSKAKYRIIKDDLYVLGDESFTLANMFHAEAQRPMAKGVLNPNNPLASVIMKELIFELIGKSETGDVLWFSIPADPVDAEYNNIFHTDVLKGIFRQLGYEDAKPVNEGLAVIYSTFPESLALPSMGLSFGSGMCNITYSFLGMPVFSFSISKSGDWIDENVATATNNTKAASAYAKESRKMDLMSPKDNVEMAIAIYYDALIGNIIKEFKKIYETKSKKDLPNIMSPIKVAVAGGTSLAIGFIQKLETALKDESFPIPVGDVVHADDPLMSISEGVWFAAKSAK